MGGPAWSSCRACMITGWALAGPFRSESTSNMTSRFVERAERTYDLFLRSTLHLRDEYVIDLGEAFRVSKLPESHVVIHDAGTYSLTWRQRDNRVLVRREIHLKRERYKPEEHAGFVAWCKGIDDAEQRKLELRKR